MGLFGNPRKNKDKWASIVMAGTKPGMDIHEETLDAATQMFVMQHVRIFSESYNIVISTKNSSTRKSRFKLAKEHWSELVRVKPYCNREQKKTIDNVTADYLKLEDFYKHPNKYSDSANIGGKKSKREQILDDCETMEIMDIFFGDD